MSACNYTKHGTTQKFVDAVAKPPYLVFTDL